MSSMNYLFLSFENAAVIFPRYRGNPKDHWISGIGKVPFKFPNEEKPIGVNQLSNALHVMAGLAPVASNRPSVFKRCEVIYEMAKNSFIKYDDVIDEEMFNNAKFLDNSNIKIKEVIKDRGTLNKKDGESCVLNWTYFKRAYFESSEVLGEIMQLFNSLVGTEDVTKKYSFVEFGSEFRKYLKDERVIDFLKKKTKYFLKTVTIGKLEEFLGFGIDRLSKGEKPKIKVNTSTFWYFLVGKPGIGSNLIAAKGYNPNAMLVTKGVDFRKRKYSGKIAVPITDNRVVEQLSEVGVNPTILDGGLLVVENINWASSEDLELVYTKISE
jgi:hypothetical protein